MTFSDRSWSAYMNSPDPLYHFVCDVMGLWLEGSTWVRPHAVTGTPTLFRMMLKGLEVGRAVVVPGVVSGRH
jgi:hypothetical protein